MILLTGCGSIVDAQQSEELGIEADLQQNEELSEWRNCMISGRGKSWRPLAEKTH